MNCGFTRKSLVMVIGASLALSGCAATQTALAHRNLNVSSRMSETIFLDPVPERQRTIYVQVRNTSDQALNTTHIAQELSQALLAKGYQTVSSEQAHYVLQANVLAIGKMDEAAAQSALQAGFGGALVGMTLASTAQSSLRGVAGGAIAGGLSEMLADTLVKNVTYSAITDIQISEAAVPASNGNSGHAGLDAAAVKKSPSGVQQGSGRWSYYRTRMVSTANQVNLSFDEALPQLQNQWVHALSGLF